MTDKEFWDKSFEENQSALAAHHQRLATPKFIQPDLPFPTQAPIVAPHIGDRLVEIDPLRNRPREGVFIGECEYLGATFWQVNGGETFLPRACQIISP